MNLQSLSNFCGKLNLGGLITLEYAPTRWINRGAYEQIISAGYNWQKTVLFNYGDWLTAPVLIKGKLWKESYKRNKQGGYYSQDVNGILPFMRPEVSGEFDKMERLTFLLKLKDGNGKDWLLGTLDSPFEFQVKNTTGGEGDLNHYAIRFVSETAKKAFGYVPVI